MNDIDKMPSKCQGCTYWEVCEYPYICDDIKPKQAENGNLNAEFAKNPQDRPTDGLIRKQDAIAAVNDVLAEYIPTFMPWQERIPLDCALKIKALPPVYVPEINVGDMISRQAAIDLLKQMRKDGDMVPWEGKDVFARIRKLPSAQPKRGKWLPDNRCGGGYWVCSSCKYPTEAFAANVIYKYCPFCGADMNCSENPNS